MPLTSGLKAHESGLDLLLRSKASNCDYHGLWLISYELYSNFNFYLSQALISLDWGFTQVGHNPPLPTQRRLAVIIPS